LEQLGEIAAGVRDFAGLNPNAMYRVLGRGGALRAADSGPSGVLRRALVRPALSVERAESGAPSTTQSDENEQRAEAEEPERRFHECGSHQI
jgi:hypothetical protein